MALATVCDVMPLTGLNRAFVTQGLKVMARGERVVCVSDTVRDYVLRHYPATDPATLRTIPRGIDIALDDGLPLLVFSFHSPSLAPGHTPYVRSLSALDAFHDWWRTVFAYLERRGVRPASLSQIKTAALA